MGEFHERQLSADFGEFEFRAAGDDDGLTLSGYIAKFGERTLIEDWLGEYTEEIKRGAFAETLSLRGAGKIKMQFNHGHDSAIGARPIGVWTDLREDRKGLWGEGRLHNDWLTAPVRAAIESGSLDGMSFRFKVTAENWRKATKPGEVDHRQIAGVNLYEAGPVVFPAYEGTSLGVRSLEFWRSVYNEKKHERMADDAAGTLDDEVTAVVPGDNTDPETRTEADPAGGITRRDMHRMVLNALGVIPDEPDRGAA
jgi:HK97 family phage prohead protease